MHGIEAFLINDVLLLVWLRYKKWIRSTCNRNRTW